MKAPRRLSLRALLLVTTAFAVGFGLSRWQAQQRLQKLEALRELCADRPPTSRADALAMREHSGLAITLTPDPPSFLRVIGVKDASPFFVQAEASLLFEPSGLGYARFGSIGLETRPDSVRGQIAIEQRLLRMQEVACHAGADRFCIQTPNHNPFHERPDGYDLALEKWRDFAEQNGIEWEEQRVFTWNVAIHR